MNSADLDVWLKEERDRHVAGYPGPRRNVAELLNNALDRIVALEAWKTEAMEVLREIAESDYVDNALDPSRNKRVARRFVEKEDGR